MKKIINGKMYNTETAQEVGYWCNTADWKDYYYFGEALYLKRTGEFFFWKAGNAGSKYGLWDGNTGYYREFVVPATVEEAKSWTEEKLSADDYEKIFGTVSE